MKTRTEHLEEVIADNLKRIDAIFNAVDFGKVCLTSQLITAMNDFYLISKNPYRDFKEK